jgi:RNA polymerase sigma-70 factor (ECF subfamily)
VPLLGAPAETTVATPGTCPDVLTLFSQHLEDEISPEVCGEMERHLAGCSRCRGTCDSLKRTLALCHATGNATPVPPSVQASVKVALRDFLAEKA